MLSQDLVYDYDQARVEYFPKYNVVYMKWRSDAHGDDYRKPFESSLRLLNFNRGSVFILDMSYSFVAHSEDLSWAFETFLSELSKTGCSRVIFVFKDIPDGENDNIRWYEATSRRFEVRTAATFDLAVSQLCSI